jgi:hypothetical protein
LSVDDGQDYLKAGVILLPGFWRLEDKFNMPLDKIQLSDDIPKFQDKLQQSMGRFFSKNDSTKFYCSIEVFHSIKCTIILVIFQWI